MAISVVYDHTGRILAAQEVSTNKGASTVELVCGPGQSHATLDVPSKHHGKPFHEVAHLLKVTHASGGPSLIDK